MAQQGIPAERPDSRRMSLPSLSLARGESASREVSRSLRSRRRRRLLRLDRLLLRPCDDVRGGSSSGSLMFSRYFCTQPTHHLAWAMHAGCPQGAVTAEA